jgi:hypothetical protein
LKKRVGYGLFLSNNRILDQVEPECLNVADILCQGLEKPTMWHIHGLLRFSVTKEDAEIVCGVIKKVAGMIGGRMDVDSWLNTVDVEVETCEFTVTLNFITRGLQKVHVLNHGVSCMSGKAGYDSQGTKADMFHGTKVQPQRLRYLNELH